MSELMLDKQSDVEVRGPQIRDADKILTPDALRSSRCCSARPNGPSRRFRATSWTGEDVNSPTWANNIEGHINFDSGAKQYKLNERVAALLVRPRGWHLFERHVFIDGKPVSESLFDFALCRRRIRSVEDRRPRLSRQAGRLSPTFFSFPKASSPRKDLRQNFNVGVLYLEASIGERPHLAGAAKIFDQLILSETLADS